MHFVLKMMNCLKFMDSMQNVMDFMLKMMDVTVRHIMGVVRLRCRRLSSARHEDDRFGLRRLDAGG